MNLLQCIAVTEPSFLEFLNKTYCTNGKFAMVCVEKKEIKSSCIYDIKNGRGVILNVSTPEEEIFDVLCCAVFEELLRKGIHQAEFDPSVDKEMLKKLGFVQDRPFFAESLDEIIDNRKKSENGAE